MGELGEEEGVDEGVGYAGQAEAAAEEGRGGGEGLESGGGGGEDFVDGFGFGCAGVVGGLMRVEGG